MNTATESLLTDLRRRGVVVETRGDSIHVDAPPGVLNPELVSQLKRHKQHLLMELNSPSRVDKELDRFFDTCVPDSVGHGWHDPEVDDSDGICLRRGLRAEQPHPGTPAGWSTPGWVRHLAHMATACEAMHQQGASEFREQIKELTRMQKEISHAKKT